MIIYISQFQFMPTIKRLLSCSSKDAYITTTHNLMALGHLSSLWWNNQWKRRITKTEKSFIISWNGKLSTIFFSMSVCSSLTDIWRSTFWLSSIITTLIKPLNLTVMYHLQKEIELNADERLSTSEGNNWNYHWFLKIL